MSALPHDGPHILGARRGTWIWLALAAVLALYVASALRVDPVITFGTFEDDTLYFSSAKALAAGHGYILPSFPGTLAAKKYPELYPWLLAGIWKVDPNFPANVKLAGDLTLAFGCTALVIIFLMVRRWPGLGDLPALVIVGLCAFTAYFQLLSASVMSDVGFMALSLGAVWLAECSLRQEKGAAAAAGAGLLAGLSVGMRSLGIAAVAGIMLVLLARRQRSRLLWFLVPAAPLALWWLSPAITTVLGGSVAGPAIASAHSGWSQTLCYYSSYACNWRMGVTDPKALEAVVLVNLKSIVQQPGLSLLVPLVPQDSLASLVLVTLLSVAAYVGIVRHWRRVGWQPIHAFFLCYLAMVLPWPYTPDRFLLVFVPLLFAGLWLEGRQLASLIAKHFQANHSNAERVVAVAMTLAALALAVTVAANYIHGIPAKITSLRSDRQRLLADKREAYDWIRQNTAPDARLLAYEDGALFLYTGRQSIRPIACLPQSFYQNDPRFAEHDSAHLADVADHVGAAYWFISPDDFALEGPRDFALLHAREKEWLAKAPVRFRSGDGRVTVADAHCVEKAAKLGCTAMPALPSAMPAHPGLEQSPAQKN